MTPDEAAAAVRAGIRIDPDEPTVWMVDLERQALAALDVLVAAAQRADRLAEALRQLGWMPNSDSPFWCFCREPSEPGDHHTDACTLAGGLMATTGEVGTDADPPSADALTDSLGRSHVDLTGKCYVCGTVVPYDQGWHRDGKAWCSEHRPVWSRAALADDGAAG